MKDLDEIYPDKMLRGISSFAYIEQGILQDEVFKLDPVREDGYCEISITWYDNQDAFNVLMSQMSDRRSELQFKAGAAELDRGELNRKMKHHLFLLI